MIAARLKRLLPARASLYALLAGAANTLAFAPFDIWPLAVASPLALYVLLRGLSARAAFGRGFAYGTGFWLAGVSWVIVSIHVYGYTPLPMAALLTLLFALMLALLFFAWWTALYAWLGRGAARPLLFVTLWVLAEWVRSWLLSGFPWLYQGYAFLDTPLAALAPLGGVLLVSAAAVGSAVLLVDLARGTAPQRRLAVALFAVLLPGCWLLDGVSWTKPADAPRTVSLVQGNIPQDLKWLREMQQPTIDIYVQLSDSEWGRDLIVWPESAIPLYAHQAADTLTALETRARAAGSGLVLGIPTVQQSDWAPPVFHNSVLSLTPEPTWYHKRKLVPFGEFVPLAGLFRAIAPFFSLPMMPLDGFSPGAEDQLPLPAAGMALETLICYEVVYPALVREQAVRSNVLLTVSNDAWFGESHGPRQHMQIARMRALENGRWLLRATNTGVTAIVDDQGDVVASLPQFRREVLRGEVVPMTGSTPWMTAGNTPLLGVLGAVLVAAAWRRRRGAG